MQKNFFSRGAVAGVIFSMLIPAYLLLIKAPPLTDTEKWTAVAMLIFGAAHIGYSFYGALQLAHDEIVNSTDRLKKTLKDNINSRAEVSKNLVDLNKQISSVDKVVATVKVSVEKLSQNATFLSGGFIEVQRRAVSIEQAPKSENSLRYAIHNHIPSHLRDKELELSMANKIYKNWEPFHQIPLYKDLINERSKALDHYVEEGGVLYDYFTEQAFLQYLNGETQFDPIKDPQLEVLTRLDKLLQLIEKENYYIFVVKSRDLGPSMLLRIDRQGGEKVVGSRMLVDMRTPGHSTNFETKSYGIYSTDLGVCLSTEEKLTRNMADTESIKDKEKIKAKLLEVKSIVQNNKAVADFTFFD